MATILVLNGPNLNLLGSREPALYGHDTLMSISARLTTAAQTAGHQLEFFQSNSEHELIDSIHKAFNRVEFILFNPAAFTHTSVALRDAILAVSIPFIEVHLSNIYRREEFRRHSFFSDIAKGVISGLGAQGYDLALQAALRHLNAAA
ncbi:MAG: type II 3-dehydroquinate dehydratase [Gammaproteobacteria bacterium]|nr:type II 3-dehydroquinate dehydratase [Gammaproteobacteria bacterium]